MSEVVRIEDFQEGAIACRGCKSVLLLTKEQQHVEHCGYTYDVEIHRVDLVVRRAVPPPVDMRQIDLEEVIESNANA